MKVVVVVSARAEWRVVKEILAPLSITHTPLGESFDSSLPNSLMAFVTFFHGGWGKISAAASAQYIIDRYKPDLLINIGTCGGLLGRIETGTIILVERTIVYDIIEQMSDPDEAIQHYASSLDLSWLPDELPHPVSRGLLVSADRDILATDIPMLMKKYNAVAADWESGAIAWVAGKNNTRLLILRGVTDLVGGFGGEAYGNIALFQDRTRTVMQQLLGQLPDWIIA